MSIGTVHVGTLWWDWRLCHNYQTHMRSPEGTAEAALRNLACIGNVDCQVLDLNVVLT